MSSDSTTELKRLVDRLCAQGPQMDSAIDELVGRVYDRTRRLAKHLFRVSFPRLGATHETGTVHHEALIRIRSALDRSQPATVEEFWALSTRIIRNTLVDLARRYDRSPLRDARSLDATGSRNPSGSRPDEPAGPDEAHEVVEAWTLLHNRVSRLPKPQREVFELCFYNGLSQREAAKVLERDPATVSRLWRRAIAELPQLDL